MTTTLQKEILGVRSLLGEPLDNAPSVVEIIEALEEVYQHVTNLTNNTGNAWQTSTVEFTTTVGVREYEIQPNRATNFYKPLVVTTVPANTTTEPEYILQMVEQEHLSQEWSWLSQNNGVLFYSSHSAFWVAFYQKISSKGNGVYCEIRPTPNKVETYKILYQVGDWWNTMETGEKFDFLMPHHEHRFYLRRLAVNVLLDKKKVRWHYNKTENEREADKLRLLNTETLKELKPSFEAHIASLDNADIITLETYGDKFYLR